MRECVRVTQLVDAGTFNNNCLDWALTQNALSLWRNDKLGPTANDENNRTGGCVYRCSIYFNLKGLG